MLKNLGCKRGEEFFHKARRNKEEGRDLRLRRNEAFGKKARRPKGILPPCHGAASLPILPFLWIRCRVRFFNRLLGPALRAPRPSDSVAVGCLAPLGWLGHVYRAVGRAVAMRCS